MLVLQGIFNFYIGFYYCILWYDHIFNLLIIEKIKRQKVKRIKNFIQKQKIKLLNNRLTNKQNNYALVALFKPEISAYLNISTGYPSVDQKIKDYLKLYVTEKSTQAQANVTIAIGLPKKNSIIESENWFTQKNYGWFFTNSIWYNNKVLGSKPYNGIVGGFKDDTNNNKYIIVGGNDIDGLLAATKRLISARSLFFNNLDKNKVSVIGDLDISGISVTDLLKNSNNLPYYNQRGSPQFQNVVDRILKNNNYQIAIKTVQRLKNEI